MHPREGVSVSPEQSRSEKRADPGLGNADFRWAEFDSEAYFQHYYGESHPDDDAVVRSAVAAMKLALPAGNDLNVVDVGTGPNLIPLFCALPRAAKLTAWEYAPSNIAWLAAELAQDNIRPQWRHSWSVARDAYLPDYVLPDDPLPLLRAKTALHQGSIFDLPERAWDAATMFFCAESITGRQDEFEVACAAYARCVKPGGMLAAAFLVGTSRYVVAGRQFPILSLSADSIERSFARHATDIKAEKIGIVDHEIRSGYSGFVFLTGVAR
jgi:hypothetical protein